MDLLQGYGSDSNDESDDSMFEGNDNVKVHNENNSSTQINERTNFPARMSDGGDGQVQKRRLLSLSAVLPRDIFDRFTKSHLYSDDDEEEEFEKEGDSRRKELIGSNNNEKTIQDSKNENGIYEGKSTYYFEQSEIVGPKCKNGMESLLRDLKSNAAGPLALGKNNDCVILSKGSEKRQSEKVGFPLSNFVTITEIKSKNERAIVENKVLNVHDDQNSNISISSTVANDDEETIKDFLPHVHMKPSAMHQQVKVRAAPIVESESFEPSIYPIPSTDDSSQNIMLNSQRQEKNQHGQINQAKSISHVNMNKKFQRKMQKALLAGEVPEEFSNDSIAIEIEVPLSTYTPTREQQALALSHSYEKAGVRSTNGGGEIYDASMGKMVPVSSLPDSNHNNSKLSHKMRSKHQIHQLVQSAHILEAKRRANAAWGIGDSYNAIKRSRGDAKRKYGW